MRLSNHGHKCDNGPAGAGRVDTVTRRLVDTTCEIKLPHLCPGVLR